MNQSGRMTTSLGILALLAALAPGPAASIDDQLAAKAKAAASRKAYEQARVFFLERRIAMDTAYLWAIRALDSKLALCENDAERSAALLAHLEDLKAIERILRAAGRVGQTNLLEFASIDYYRIEAEQWVAHGRIAPTK